jgi:hypothetical protein
VTTSGEAGFVVELTIEQAEKHRNAAPISQLQTSTNAKLRPARSA